MFNYLERRRKDAVYEDDDAWNDNLKGGTRKSKDSYTYRKDGTRKAVKGKSIDDGYMDPGEKYKGRSKAKFTKDDNVKSVKNVSTSDGRRYVDKYDRKSGTVTSKSRRTLKGFLTGKGKGKKTKKVEKFDNKNQEHVNTKLHFDDKTDVSGL